MIAFLGFCLLAVNETSWKSRDNVSCLKKSCTLFFQLRKKIIVVRKFGCKVMNQHFERKDHFLVASKLQSFDSGPCFSRAWET